MMGNHNPDMQKGLDSVFECYHLDWLTNFEEIPHLPEVDQRTIELKRVHRFDPRNPSGEQRKPRGAKVQSGNDYPTLFDEKVLKAFAEFNPDIVFIHTQRSGVVSNGAAAEMRKTAKVVNFTGDVRWPVPDFYKSLGRNIDMTLFTNMEDVNELKRLLIPSDFLQVGFDSENFNPDGPVNEKTPEIVFLGNNYGRMFPLSEQRELMVRTLKEVYKDRVGIYGTGWNEWGNGPIESYSEEGKVYRGCKIAISLSHFNRSRYASDRLFRIMGSGAFCLTHDYKELDLDFIVGQDLDKFDGKNINELISKINYYLENEQEREEIALNGCIKARQMFTWHNFAENLEVITNNIKK